MTNQLHNQEEQVMDDTFQMSTGQAHELALALGRNGWTTVDVKRASEGDILARLLPVVRGQAVVTQIPAYPADGETFKLTLDFDAPENQPLEMVRRDGYGGQWRHNGPKATGTQTRKFKWVGIGYQPNFDSVKQKLAKHGKIPEGPWREAVKGKFRPDGQHLRGIADASWVFPYGYAYFPYVNSDGNSNFNWTDNDFNDNWRWLVEVSE